ncbi:hypothetical protein CI238_00401 [Colletotrichum incanum]|uniref:Uncharacterized protein n=1 Tax=Colletotrichum incanum TaxID=1573173 RepID=A0A167BI72_COLIC|nr:hypothetical protein CI238_00401 [Colletotrichum incanum]OHW93081.1 hypothetical protein CSPAE12_08388 [Colletotrichum incanum]
MVIAPEKQTRYWRYRSPYPRPNRITSPSPSAHKSNYESDENNFKEENRSFEDEVQQLHKSNNKVMTLVNKTDFQSPRHQQVDEKSSSSTQGQGLKPPLKRSITWDPKFDPWNSDRFHASHRSTQSNIPFTDFVTSRSDHFTKLSLSEEDYSDEILRPRNPRFRPVRPKLTTVDIPRSPLYKAEDGSARIYSPIADNLKSPRLTARNSTYQNLLNTEYMFSLGHSRAPSLSFPVPRQQPSLAQWSPNVSTAAVSPSTGHPSGEAMVVFRESIWCHCVNCKSWKRSSMSKPRGMCLNARIIPRKEAAEKVAEKVAEKMDWLAMWLIVGLVGVWVLLMVVNLRLAGYEVALEWMH